MTASSNFKLPDEGGAAQWLNCLGMEADEQRLYAALLRHSPQTGYQLAAATGAAPASAHAALTSLVRKGAAVACANRVSTSYVAVPLDELQCSLPDGLQPPLAFTGAIRSKKTNLFFNNPDTDDYRKSRK